MSEKYILDEIKAEIDRKWEEDQSLLWSAGRWGKTIVDCKEDLATARSRFVQPAPLRAYSSITNAGKALFSLRFKGQEVGMLRVKVKEDKQPEVELIIEARHRDANRKYFQLGDFFEQTGSFDWQKSEYAKAFRSKFQDIFQVRAKALPKGSNNKKKSASEHHVESLMLEEMQNSTKNKFGGTCHHIQPIMVGGCPFQCPLPLSFSAEKKVKSTRGNIDILARNNKRQLSVWELKKPGLGLATKAHIQVFTYAYTLLKMLRSEHGNSWWTIFGFKDGSLPSSIVIEAVPVFGVLNLRQRNYILKKLEEFLGQNLGALFSEHQNGTDRIQFRLAFYDLDHHQDPRIITIPEKYTYVSDAKSDPNNFHFIPTGDSW